MSPQSFFAQSSCITDETGLQGNVLLQCVPTEFVCVFTCVCCFNTTPWCLKSGNLNVPLPFTRIKKLSITTSQCMWCQVFGFGQQRRIGVPLSTVSKLLINVSPLFVSEPDGGEQSVISYYYHLSMVSELLHHIIFKQEGFVGGENYVFPFGRIFP